MSREPDTYTHGHHDSVLRSPRWRTGANSAAHLLPRLVPGETLLDVGCGPGTITLDLARAVAPGAVGYVVDHGTPRPSQDAAALLESEEIRELYASIDLVADLPPLPLTTKAELKGAIEEEPPFGSHLAVPPADVKRVYQTSGTTGRPSLIALTRQDIRIWATIGARRHVPLDAVVRALPGHVKPRYPHDSPASVPG